MRFSAQVAAEKYVKTVCTAKNEGLNGGLPLTVDATAHENMAF